MVLPDWRLKICEVFQAGWEMWQVKLFSSAPVILYVLMMVSVPFGKVLFTMLKFRFRPHEICAAGFPAAATHAAVPSEPRVRSTWGGTEVKWWKESVQFTKHGRMSSALGKHNWVKIKGIQSCPVYNYVKGIEGFRTEVLLAWWIKPFP